MATDDDGAPDLGAGEQLPLQRARRRRRRRVGTERTLPSGNVQIRFRGTLPNGEPFELNATCAPEHVTEVRAELVRRQREYKDGLARPELRLTLRDYKERFVRSKPWSAERNTTWKRLRPLWQLPLGAIDDRAVSRWAQSIVWKGPGERPPNKISPGYLRHCFELLRVMLIQAVRDRVIAQLPCSARPHGIPSHKAAFKKRRVATSDELAAILRAAQQIADDRPGHSDLPLRIVFAVQCGARPHAELAHVRRDWLAGHVPGMSLVPGAGVVKFPANKGGDAHTATLYPELYRALLEHFYALPPAAQATGLLFPVFIKRRWRARDQFVTHTLWKELRRRAGVEDLVLYQLRHTRLTDVANDPRLGPRAAQAIAGHTDVRTTQGYLSAPQVTSSAAFEPSATLARALQSSARKPDDDEPPPGGASPESASTAPGTRTAARKQRRATTRKVARTRASMPRAGAQQPVPAERARQLPGDSVDEGDRAQLLALCARLAVEPMHALVEAMLGALGPLQAAQAARELRELLCRWDALPELERGRLERFAVAVLDASRAAVLVSAPKSGLSQRVSGGLMADGSCFTSPICHEHAGSEVIGTKGKKA